MMIATSAFLDLFQSPIQVPHADALLLLAFLVVAWCAPHLGELAFGPIERTWAQFAARKSLAIWVIFLAVILVRVSLLPLIPLPVPEAQDEFGYLLSADTFAHGRLTNPPHPMWAFFDTFQINQQPTYMSRYPPAQGAVMALGQVFGHPWIGVLLSVAAMCAAILWMLQAWVPPAWALLGASLVFLRIGILSYWMNSYWGGAVAATGGAFVLGSLPRIMREQRRRDALWLGLGIAILANSRPVEGFIFCLPVAVVLTAWLIGKRSPALRVTVPRVIVPLAAVLVLTAGFIGYYNWRVTGDPLLPPFVLNQRVYFRGQPVFVWQKKLPPTHTLNAQFDSYYNIFPGGFDGTLRGTLLLSWNKVARLNGFFLFREFSLLIPFLALPWIFRDQNKRLFTVQIALWIGVILVLFLFLPAYARTALSVLPLLAIVWLWRDRAMRFLLVQFFLCFLGFFAVIAFLLHYAAPVAATFLVLLVQALRYLRGWVHRNRPVGIGLSRMVVLFAIVVVPIRLIEAVKNPSLTDEPYLLREQGSLDRAAIRAEMEAMPGQHLVIVRYSPEHNFQMEYVYNRADIDHAKVVWAREIPGVDVQPLLDYFRGRQIWLLEPDVSPPRLLSYPRTATNAMDVK
jgi:hypothetical protein